MLKLENIRKTLFVVTGDYVVRSKPKVCEKLKNVLGVDPIDLYKLQLQQYQRYGFMSIKEREILYDIGVKTMFAETFIRLNDDNNVVVVGEFDVSYQDWLYNIAHTYGYDTFIINCQETDFEASYNLFSEVLSNPSEQDKPRYACKYIPEVLYVPNVVLDDMGKEWYKMEYDKQSCLKLIGGRIMTDTDFMQEVE